MRPFLFSLTATLVVFPMIWMTEALPQPSGNLTTTPGEMTLNCPSGSKFILASGTFPGQCSTTKSTDGKRIRSGICIQGGTNKKLAQADCEINYGLGACIFSIDTGTCRQVEPSMAVPYEKNQDDRNLSQWKELHYELRLFCWQMRDAVRWARESTIR